MFASRNLGVAASMYVMAVSDGVQENATERLPFVAGLIFGAAWSAATRVACVHGPTCIHTPAWFYFGAGEAPRVRGALACC